MVPTIIVAPPLKGFLTKSVDNIAERVSERFHFLLNKFKVSKYKLNKELGLPNTSLYNWQNGKREPSIESIMKLAEYFNCSIDYIVGREK